MKERRAIITQFDKIAAGFERSRDVGTDLKVQKGKQTVTETAGLLKKKTKKKKEKTLSAKLRLKEKKKWWACLVPLPHFSNTNYKVFSYLMTYIKHPNPTP